MEQPDKYGLFTDEKENTGASWHSAGNSFFVNPPLPLLIKQLELSVSACNSA